MVNPFFSLEPEAQYWWVMVRICVLHSVLCAYSPMTTHKNTDLVMAKNLILIITLRAVFDLLISLELYHGGSIIIIFKILF